MGVSHAGPGLRSPHLHDVSNPRPFRVLHIIRIAYVHRETAIFSSLALARLRVLHSLIVRAGRSTWHDTPYSGDLTMKLEHSNCHWVLV
jgi:hypothetical protein